MKLIRSLGAMVAEPMKRPFPTAALNLFQQRRLPEVPI
jgi:hypothetical protein